MREHHPEHNERAMERTANPVEQSVHHSMQMPPIPRAFDGVDPLRMKSAIETLADQSGPQATGIKRVSNRLKKGDDEEEALLLAQAPADTSSHNNVPPSENAISVVSEAAFNPECTVTNADGCGLAVGAAGNSVAIAPWLFLPLLALGGGGGGSSEPAPTLNFTSGPELFDGDSSKQVNVSKLKYELNFDTDKDLTGKVRYELISSTDFQDKHGATIDPKTGVIKFSSFDKFCIGDELQFTIKAIYEDGAKKAASTYTFSIDVIGPESSINATASDAYVVHDASILTGTTDLDTLAFDFNALGLNPELSTENIIYFGLDGTSILCIRFGDQASPQYVELNTANVEYIYFGAAEDYNQGDPTSYIGSIFGYELNAIYKLNQTANLMGSNLTADGSEIDCDQLIYGAWDDFGGIQQTVLTGGTGNDIIFGSEIGRNTLMGGEGNDFLMAISMGGNRLEGGAGADVLVGSTGEDIFIYSSSEFGQDKIRADKLDVFEIDGNEYLWDDVDNRWGYGESSYIEVNQLGYWLDGSQMIAAQFIA